jgi:hypothetical protein
MSLSYPYIYPLSGYVVASLCPAVYRYSHGSVPIHDKEAFVFFGNVMREAFTGLCLCQLGKIICPATIETDFFPLGVDAVACGKIVLA